MSEVRANALSAAENRAIGMIAGGVGLQEVLDELCRTIDLLTPGVVSTVLLMDPDGKRLWPGGGPAFPAALKPAINPWTIGPDRGLLSTSHRQVRRPGRGRISSRGRVVVSWGLWDS